MSKFIVYESMDSRERLIEDHVRFLLSREKLSEAGITFEVVTVSDAEDIKPSSDAYEQVCLYGMDCLPISTYCDTLVDKGAYPSDGILADYLDAPNGLLSADKASVPAANDREFSCIECRRY